MKNSKKRQAYIDAARKCLAQARQQYNSKGGMPKYRLRRFLRLINGAEVSLVDMGTSLEELKILGISPEELKT